MKRECRISTKQFKSIFPNRTITTRTALAKSFYFVEDEDGNYTLEERDSLLSILLSIPAFILLIIPCLLWCGLRTLPEWVANQYEFMKGGYTRRDMCFHGVEPTNRLIALSGWQASNQR